MKSDLTASVLGLEYMELEELWGLFYGGSLAGKVVAA